MKPIIKIENLSKQYRLGTIGTGTISNDLKRWWYRVRGKDDPFLQVGAANNGDKKGHSEYVWALQDINLEIMPGEVLGIIGKNGAGKSTLLKILSKVTGPTKGNIHFNGRIGSLLEVGTGFHPELTGRENIFLNGAILGMTKQEIRSKLDEIVGFSGCEKYIDTPVKRYSSGMKVRLGFAVAAHLEPEILVVDEVLAVGDAEFQRKAIGKMQDVSRSEGRTVLFVSHNMSSIQKLCSKALLLQSGKVETLGPVKSTIEKYFMLNKESININNIYDYPRINGYGQRIKISSIEILNAKGEQTSELRFGEPYKIKVVVKALIKIENIDISVRIDSETNTPISSIVSSDQGIINSFKQNQLKEFQINLDQLLLTPGYYSLVVTIKSNRVALDRLENIVKFEVLSLTYDNKRPHNELWGYVQSYPQWEVKQ